MKKKLFLLPGTLLGAMLFALPAMADPIAVDENGIPVPLTMQTLGVSNVWMINELLSPPTSKTMVVTPDATGQRIAVLGTDIAGYVYDFDDLFISSEVGLPVTDVQLNGLRFQNAGADFIGSLTGNSITVFNHYGDAYGVAAYDTMNAHGTNAADLDSGALIDITNIAVVSIAGGAYGATGAVAGTLKSGSQVYLGADNSTWETTGGITAASTSWATGVELDATESNSRLVVGEIMAIADGAAHGILIGGSQTADMGYKAYATVGGDVFANSITAVSNGTSGAPGTNAFGIKVDGITSGWVEIGTINASSYRNAYGALFQGDVDGGTVNIDSVNVYVKDSPNAMFAAGVALMDINSGSRTDITNYTFFSVGDIDVTSESTDPLWGAVGFVAGNLTGTVILDSITARAQNYAIGVELHSINTSSQLQVSDITAEAIDGEAVGIKIDGGNADIALNGGTINAFSENANAAGIRVNSDAKIILFGDVAITASGATNSVGIQTGNDLTVNVQDYNLTADSVTAGGAATIVGDGRADLGVAAITGNFTVGNSVDATTVAVDLVNSTFSGTNTITDFATLEGYGDTDNTALVHNFGGNGTFVNNAVFTNWQWDGTQITNQGVKKYANMSDGFLAAATIHNRYTGYNMVRDKFISGNTRAGSGILGQAPCEEVGCNPCDPCGSFVGGGLRTAWVNYVGRGDTYGNWDLGSDGVQIGTDLYRTKRNQIGMIFGYEGGWARFLNDRVNSDDIYVGLYGAHVFRNGADVRFIYNYGSQDFDMTRSGWKAKFDGKTQEINLELGKRLHGGAWSLRPLIGMDFFLNDLDAARETGAGLGSAISYNKLNTTQWFLRAGFDLRYQVKRFTFNTGMFYAYDLEGAAFQTRVSSVAAPALSAILQGSKLGREVVSVNVGGDYKIGSNFSVFGGYDLQAVTDRSGGNQHIGYVGGAWRW